MKLSKLLAKFIAVASVTMLLPSQSIFATSTLHPTGLLELHENIPGIKPAPELYGSAVNIPSSLDLSSEFPAVGDQGTTLGSCVGFAVGYADKSYQEHLDWGWNLDSNSHIFSPTYIYSQIHASDASDGGGSNLSDAFNLVENQGCTTLDDMPYNGDSYGWKTQPTDQQKVNASKYKAKEWEQLPSGNYDEIKAQIANRNPVIISIPVYSDFDSLNASNPIYDTISGQLRGYHAVCVVGYDDSKRALKIINSWGTSWGINGYGWISYDLIQNQNIDAYTMSDTIDSTTYGSFKLHTGTALKETDSSWKYLLASNNDIYAIKQNNTGTHSTEVHVLSAASNYQSFSLEVGTALPETDSTYQFLLAPNNDLYVIKQSATGTHSTEVHVLSAASNYQQYSNHTGTALAETGSNYKFLLGSNNDIYVIQQNGTGTNSTEVHVLSAASNYQQFSKHTGTALPEAELSSNYQYMLSANNDLYAIKKSSTETNSTEVSAVTASSNYQNYLLKTGTALSETDANYQFLLGPNNDIYVIKQSGTGSNSTEVHVLKQ